MDRSVLLRALCALFFPLLFSCPALAAEKPTVLVSIPPQKYFVERLAGDAALCAVLVDKGGDPHTYEPTVSVMTQAAQAKLYFTIGLPFERQWLPRFQDLSPDMRVLVPAASRLSQPESSLLEGSSGAGHDEHPEHDGHDGHEHSEDPHIWLSPAVMAEVVPELRDALIAIVPEAEETIRQNGEVLLGEMAALEKTVKALFAALPEDKRAFLTFHHAWGYYAQNFGLREASVEYMGKEPGPRSMAAIIGLAREHGIRTIVVSPGTNRASAEAVANNIGGTLVEADLMAEDWPDNLLRLSKALAESLGR